METMDTVEVRTAKVIKKAQIRRQGLPGTVHPADQAVLAAKLMATVSRADVVIGQAVKEGEVLLVLEAREIQAQVEQAEAMLAQLNRNLEREQNLLAQRATTAEAVRTLEDQIRLARAQLAEAQTMESYTRLKAPFDGTITAKEVRRGDLATPGMPLLSMQGEGSRQVYVQVPDSLMAVGYNETVLIEANRETFNGKLSEWSPAADPASRTRLAKLDIMEDAPARSGQYVRVLWPVEETTFICMPKSALSPMGQMERVFVYNDGHLELRLVKTGMESGENIQILAGLSEGDQVVLSPDATLRDGQPAILLP
jgi:RND family efflux transporter MFP subunit